MPLQRRSTSAIDSIDMHILAQRLPEVEVKSLASEVLSRVAARHDGPLQDAHVPHDDEIEEISQALIAAAPDTAMAVVDRLRSDGIGPEALYLTYLAGAARRLGEWWNEDAVTFVQVTIGASRILSILRMLDHQAPDRIKTQVHRAAIFASVPGEIHTLGVRMAADLFRRDGWDIVLETGLSHDNLIDSILTSQRQFIGLSAGGTHSIPALAKLVVALRVATPKAAIMVSGQVVNEAESVVQALSPDFIVRDVASARRAMKGDWQQHA